jgi:mevalonate kinase
MFGDAALGETNLAMIATARSVGAAAKFTGSGGAIVAYCPEGEQQEQRLKGETVCTVVQGGQRSRLMKPSQEALY